MDRPRLLEMLADEVVGQVRDRPLLVAVDGVDGAGKTVFADELAEVLGRRGVAVVRASVDGFHHPARRRYRRGRTSPEGFFLDSYDYGALTRLLLDPLGPRGSRRIVRAVHDVATDEAVDTPAEVVGDEAVLVLDGIFLHRPELRDHWDLSVFLDVPFAVSIARGAARDGGDPDPGAAVNRRYVEGQRHYLARCAPQRHATHVVDNTDLHQPRLLTGTGRLQRRAAVLFDLDGVLVDSLALHRRVWTDWAQLHGLDPHEVFEATFGRRPLDTIREVAGHLTLTEELARLNELLEAHAHRVRLHAGALSAVDIAAQGPWAIVTSTDRPRAVATLTHLGCPCPSVVIGADDVAAGKPAPDGYLAAAHRLGVEPGDCLVVEDSPAGIDAGHAAGATVLAIASTRPAGELAAADLLASDLDAATRLLRDWLARIEGARSLGDVPGRDT